MEEKCECCKVLKGYVDKCYQKILVPLEGGWVLNHYGGDHTYLGWLVMATKYHHPSWDKLEPRELEFLGKNIQRINKGLHHYWEDEYSEDGIEQIYAVYFNETPYKKGLSGDELLKELHVHIHLLTRTKEMRGNLCCPKSALGWHLVDCTSCFPDKYKLSDMNYPKARKLMEYLERKLQTGDNC